MGAHTRRSLNLHIETDARWPRRSGLLDSYSLKGQAELFGQWKLRDASAAGGALRGCTVLGEFEVAVPRGYNVEVNHRGR